MSRYTIEIDDKLIAKQMNDILNTILTRQLNNKYTETDYVIRDAVKELIYSHKAEIIEKVVDRAAREIVKKGLPKLIERCDNG